MFYQLLRLMFVCLFSLPSAGLINCSNCSLLCYLWIARAVRCLSTTRRGAWLMVGSGVNALVVPRLQTLCDRSRRQPARFSASAGELVIVIPYQIDCNCISDMHSR